MNSLEFIERKIIEVEHEIKINKLRLENLWDKTFYKGRAEVLNNKLQTLQQIKTELEAWEVVKNIVQIKRGEVFDHVLRIKQGKGALTHEEFRKLKKALEVTNETRK